ncbi:MAG: AI-2E family transporter [Actinobacteria bacterium]|nr:AI-2E family transporter [Actinomycetota bacterium]
MSTPPRRPSAQLAIRNIGRSLRSGPGDGVSSAAIVRMVLTVVVVLAVLWVAWVSRGVLVWAAIAAFLAVAIDPLVRIGTRRFGMPRAAAIALVFLVGLLVVAGAALLFIPPMVDAARGLVTSLPAYIDRLSSTDLFRSLDREYNLLGELKTQATRALSGIAGPGAAVSAAQRVLSGLIALISIAVLTFLMSLNGPRLRRWAVELPGTSRGRERAARAIDSSYQVIAGYIVGVLLIAVLGASAAAIFMLIVGIPYVAILAVWVGLMAFVPMIGAIAGGAPYVAVGFFQSWQVGVAALAFLVVYQQIENNLVQPLVQRRTIKLNPLWIIIAVLVGTQAFGIIGTLVSIPVAGIIQVLVQEWVRSRGTSPGEHGGPDATEPDPA